MTAAEEGVLRTLREYQAACKLGDVDAYMATIAEDVVFMPPDQPPLDGHNAVRAWIKKDFFDPYDVNLDCTFDRIVPIGSEAFAPGTFRLELTPKSGGDAVTGAFFNIFREESDGSWKYTYGIFNFDAPLA